MSNLRKAFLLGFCMIVIALALISPSISYAAEDNRKEPQITCTAGETPLKQAVYISLRGWKQSDSVVIASGTDFPDVLAGSAFAITKDAPILYTASTQSLDNYKENINWNEIVRLKAKRIYILGGTGAVSQSIEWDLQKKGMEVIRINGIDRFETAKAIGDELIKRNNTHSMFLSYAYNFSDAIAASTFAGQMGCPIMLTDTGRLNPTTQNAIKEWNIKTVYITGGTSVISQGVEDNLISQGIQVIRIAGIDQYETAQKIIKMFKPDVDCMTVATGTDFHNALVGSVYGYKINHPVMLFDKNMDKGIKEFVWSCSDLMCIGKDFFETPSISTPMSGSLTQAGVFVSRNLVTVDKSADYETNLAKLQGMIGKTYFLKYAPSLTWDNVHFAEVTFLYDKSTNRYGLKICEWRRSYDSSIAENCVLNATLETFYFLCGDKHVATALWKWFDARGINGYADSNDYGFRDVDDTTIEMNNTKIDITMSGTTNILYFH